MKVILVGTIGILMLMMFWNAEEAPTCLPVGGACSKDKDYCSDWQTGNRTKHSAQSLSPSMDNNSSMLVSTHDDLESTASPSSDSAFTSAQLSPLHRLSLLLLLQTVFLLLCLGTLSLKTWSPWVKRKLEICRSMWFHSPLSCALTVDLHLSVDWVWQHILVCAASIIHQLVEPLHPFCSRGRLMGW